MSELDMEVPKGTNHSDRLYQNIASLIYQARGLYVRVFHNIDINEFYQTLVYPTQEFGEPTTHAFFDVYKKSVEMSGEENSPEQRRILIPLACAHLGEALSYAADGYREVAWESLVMAQLTISKLEGIMDSEKKSPESSASLMRMVEEHARVIISERARKAAGKTHEVNRAVREEAYRWLDDHYEQDGLTIDRAAEALRKIVPMEFSTRRTYVKSWKASR